MEILSQAHCAVNDLFPDTITDPLIGRTVKLETEHRCGSTQATIAGGRGPHAGSVICVGCGKYRQWISRQSYSEIGKFVAEAIRVTGEPAEITFRKSSGVL